MSLILFLFKVSNLNISKSKADIIGEDEDISETPTTQFVTDENTILLSAKVTFRGISLWSNNVPIHDGAANFIARGQKPKKFNFNLGTKLIPDDKISIEFYTITIKRKRKKLIAIYEIMLESLINSKYIDLPQENLSDPLNCLMTSTVQLKLYYTPPDIEEQRRALGIVGQDDLINWNSLFDDEGRHGGHRYRHIHSKHDSKFKKFRTKLGGYGDDADTDSYSDSDFGAVDYTEKIPQSTEEKEKIKIEQKNLELLEKSLGRYDGNPYEVTEWQIMVHIIQGRDFPGVNLNPYVSVQIDQQKRYTSIHKSTNAPFFGEFFTFDFVLPAIQIMEKVIFFRIHHAQKIISTFTDTKPIGIFRLDISTVYNEKGHAFERKWAQMVEPENIGIPCGHLLLSLAVTERGTQAKNLFGESTQNDDEYKPSRTLVPAAMPHRLFPVQLKIIFFTATELPEMMTDFLASVSKKFLQSDSWEPVDPYVEVNYNSMQIATNHRNGTTPVWGEALYLIGRFPPLVRTIKVALKDHAAVQQDRTISSFFIDLFLISESNPSSGFLPTLGPTWIFLYGSPREYTISKDQDGLSEGMGEGVCYKGRLLMSIESHPISGDNLSTMNIQKESGIQFPDAHIFPLKRTFLLFGCIYDVTMIDKSFGNSTICFELSIGPSGYLNPQQLSSAIHNPVSSLSRPYPRIPIDNNKQYFRLPIDLQKPILFTKYIFHDYIYRITVSNRLKHVAEHLYKQIREFEMKINSKVSSEILMNEYKKIEHYVHTLPCGCGGQILDNGTFGTTPVVHPNLWELLNTPHSNIKMNVLDYKRRKKILNNIDSLKGWISKEIDFDEAKRYEIIKELNKIARSFRQMAIDAQPSLPDIFLWMICDLKRVAYARISPEDLFFNLCQGEKGLYNGRVQTIFLKTPHSTDKPIKPTTNAKVQIYLWLGIEEYEPYIFKQLPTGFDMPPLPLHPDTKIIRYNGRTFYQLRCHCYKARSLIASDETGLSDPYLSITVGNETQTTPILKQSLCPQWNITLSFKNLIHVGSRETAEEIIGNVVVECYDYDEGNDGPDLIGRFSTTAKLNLFNENNIKNESPFQWYEFKFGEKRAGELLAVFELIEVNPETREADSAFELEEILLTTDRFPLSNYITKFIRNKIYQIPEFLIPNMKTYEIEIMFWGLRECRRINFQSIEQAEVTIECAGARMMRTINDVQKHPNFESSSDETDKYKLLVSLPNDNNFWPHLSILCIQNRHFGMKETIGNLVVTDLQKYLEKSFLPLTSNNQSMADVVNEFSKRTPYDFNRVRRSVIDAYEAALTVQDTDNGKKKLIKFETEAGRNSQVGILHNNSLTNQNEENDQTIGISDDMKDISSSYQILTTTEKLKRDQMEKSAGWWNKYYASKAKLRLAQQAIANMDDSLKDTTDSYVDFFENENKVIIKQHGDLWNKMKKIFLRAGKAQKEFRRFAIERVEQLGEHGRFKSVVDESLEFIEADRLKELTLLQTFDIIESELENVYDYEHFHDCLDTFPLYKGKGSSRSDEIGDEKRIYAKFKGKLRIREVSRSSNPSLFKPVTNAITQTNKQMLKFDFNKNPITLKCRLYLIKAIIYRGWDRSGKADPYIKILLNNETIIDGVKDKLYNTLEPVFGKAYEFDVKLPIQSLLRIQLWDWDMATTNDLIGETKIDIENRWFSCHRATCGLPKRYDSVGYNTWRDTKKPTTILNELCRTAHIALPVYAADLYSVTINDERFDCDSTCIEFIKNANSSRDTVHRKVHHESIEEYTRQNTALAALHGWGRKINPKAALVTEHIECRSLFHPNFPYIEQGKLEMWLDFFPISRSPAIPMIDITPPKPVSYQLRLTIWNTTDVELNDENILTGEKTSDIYVKAWILGEHIDAQQTDIHYRSLTGEGNFNWRFIFNFDYLEIEEKIVYETKDSVFQVGNTMKKIPPRFVIRVYDADLLSADDFLGESIFDMTHLPIGAKASNKCKADILLNSKHQSTNLFINKRIAGWWPMIAPLKEGEIRDQTLLGGKVEAELALVTAEEAEQNPVGKAREAPQPLEEPNRPKTSFLWFTSPWKTLRYVIWRNFKWHIIIGILIIIFVIFILLAIWTVPSEIVKQISDKIFKNNGAN